MANVTGDVEGICSLGTSELFICH